MKMIGTCIGIILCLSAYSQRSFSLQGAIDYAIAHSRDMEIGELDIKDAESRIDEFRSIGMPQVNGGIDYNHYFYLPTTPVEDFITPSIYQVLVQEFPNDVEFPQGDPETFNFSIFTKNNLNGSVDASWLLFDGSYLTGLKAARLYRELTKQRKEVKEEELRALVTKAYMNVLIGQENKSILQDNLELAENSLAEARAFYENGFAELLDVSRLEVTQQTLSLEIDKLNQLIVLSKELLKFQMNYPQSDDLEVSQTLEDLITSTAANLPQTEVTLDIRNKEQYKEIEIASELNELNIERFKKGYLPSLSARAGASAALQRNKLFDNNEAGWIPTMFAGLSLRAPIYDGKLKKSQIQQAQIEAQKLDIQKDEFERATNLQVKNAQINHQRAVSQLQSTENVKSLNEEIYRITQIKYREGVGSSLELKQAERDLYDSQAKYIDALYQLLTTKTELDIALGKI